MYIFCAHVNPLDRGMLIGIYPLNTGRDGHVNADGPSYIGFSLSCDGVHWSPAEKLVWTTGRAGRTFAHPVQGLVYRDGTVYFYVHHHVPHISIYPQFGHIAEYPFRTDELLRLGAKVREELNGCSPHPSPAPYSSPSPPSPPPTPPSKRPPSSAPRSMLPPRSMCWLAPPPAILGYTPAGTKSHGFDALSGGFGVLLVALLVGLAWCATHTRRISKPSGRHMRMGMGMGMVDGAEGGDIAGVAEVEIGDGPAAGAADDDPAETEDSPRQFALD